MTPRKASDSASPSSDQAPYGPEKVRLTPKQKRDNHISSEQKRRKAIRDGFDKMCDMIPGFEGMGRSENKVLDKVLEAVVQNIEKRQSLLDEAEAKGISVGEEFRNFLPVKKAGISEKGESVEQS